MCLYNILFNLPIPARQSCVAIWVYEGERENSALKMEKDVHLSWDFKWIQLFLCALFLIKICSVSFAEGKPRREDGFVEMCATLWRLPAWISLRALWSRQKVEYFPPIIPNDCSPLLSQIVQLSKQTACVSKRKFSYESWRDMMMWHSGKKSATQLI